MKISRNLLINLYVGMSVFGLQLIPIWLLHPSAADFVPVKTITGIYEFDGGSVTTGTTTKVNGVSLLCSVSVWGPVGACAQRLKNQRVEATVSSYKHLFGSGEVVIEVIAMDGEKISYTPAQLVELWINASLRTSVLVSVVATIIFSFFRRIKTINKREINGK